MIIKNVRYLSTFTLLLLSGCFSFFQQSPRYVEGTDLEIRSGDMGEDYVARIGTSRTTVVEAILSGNGYYSIACRYSDSEWLLLNEIIIETQCCRNRVILPEPLREETEQGTVVETGKAEVRRNLFIRMVSSNTPIVYIRGKQGTVIIKMGSEGKRRLQELLDYGEKRFPES